jgi:hypothetical protein
LDGTSGISSGWIRLMMASGCGRASDGSSLPAPDGGPSVVFPAGGALSSFFSPWCLDDDDDDALLFFRLRSSASESLPLDESDSLDSSLDAFPRRFLFSFDRERFLSDFFSSFLFLARINQQTLLSDFDLN